jgi:hypothetical protein
MKVKTDLVVHDECIGTPHDWAEVMLTPLLVAQIRSLYRALLAFNNTRVEANHRTDNSPRLHFEPAVRVEEFWVLSVSREAFWWSGYAEGTSIRWETGRIPFAILDDRWECDLRHGQAASRPPSNTLPAELREALKGLLKIAAPMLRDVGSRACLDAIMAAQAVIAKADAVYGSGQAPGSDRR